MHFKITKIYWKNLTRHCEMSTILVSLSGHQSSSSSINGMPLLETDGLLETVVDEHAGGAGLK